MYKVLKKFPLNNLLSVSCIKTNKLYYYKPLYPISEVKIGDFIMVIK